MRKGSLIYAGWLIMLSAIAGSAESISVGDRAGLRVSFNEKGSISNLLVGGKALLSERCLSGIEIEDAVTKQNAKITGKVTSTENGIVFTGQSGSLNLQVTARIKSVGDSVYMNVKVKDLTGRDRAIRAKVVLNLKDKSWIWCEDLLNTYPARVDVRHNCPAFYAGHDQSCYPFGAVATPDGTGLAIGWPMRNPRFCSQTFTLRKDGVGELVLCADLGLASETAKFPGSADVDVVLYSFDGKQQFRGALSKYYQIYPDTFEYPFKKQGIWALWVEEGLEEYADKFGVAFNQCGFDQYESWGKVMARDDKKGYLSFQYDEPWGYWHPFPPGWYDKNKLDASQEKGLQPNRGDILVPTKAMAEIVSKDIGSNKPADQFPGTTRDKVARAVLNTAIWRDPQGDWLTCFIMRGWFGFTSEISKKERKGWDSICIIANPDPNLPHPNHFDVTWEGRIDFAEKRGKKYGGQLDGLYADSLVFAMAWDRMNFRREHWKYADIPLTFTTLPDGKVVPAQALALANVSFLKKYQAEGRKRGWPVLANGWHPLYAVCAGYIDILGAGECADPKDLTAQGFLAYFRCMAYRKPVSIQDYVLHLYQMEATPANVDQIVEPRINHYLLYGIYPGTSNSWNARAENKLKLLVPVYEKYIPIFKAINTAGWEPVTLATVNQPNVLLERWGHDTKTGLYLTLYNQGDKKITPELSIDLQSLKNRKPTQVRELLSGAILPIKTTGAGIAVSVSIEPKRTIALQVEE